MPRFREAGMSPKFIPVDFSAQILPRTFEHALSVLIGDELDLSAFTAGIKNDRTGAPAYHPAVLLKIVLLAYSKGLVSSRAIEAACRHHIVFMALSGDTKPHFSTIAAFVSGNTEAVARVFKEVLLVCDREGLIGREMFAIDGVKLPSNASKARSGRRKDFEREAEKMERAVRKMLNEHQTRDAQKSEPAPDDEAVQRKAERLRKQAQSIRQWLKAHPTDRKGRRHKTVLSNLTDNESAKMATDKGVVQGYCGTAAVDETNQIILSAQAHGSGSEQALLPGIAEEIAPPMREGTKLTADAGYHSEENLETLEQKGIDSYIADRGYRRRDPRCKGQEKHTAKDDALWDKKPKEDQPAQFKASEFQVAPDFSHCTCPAGKKLYRSGNNCNLDGRRAVKFKGTQRACGRCPLRAQCLRKPETTPIRQVAIFLGKHRDAKEKASERMRRKIDSPQGREMIARRFATVEPVFGNLRYNKRLGRFTLRGQEKVDAQWKLMCLVHNIEKLANHGYGM